MRWGKEHHHLPDTATGDFQPPSVAAAALDTLPCLRLCVDSTPAAALGGIIRMPSSCLLPRLRVTSQGPQAVAETLSLLLHGVAFRCPWGKALHKSFGDRVPPFCQYPLSLATPQRHHSQSHPGPQNPAIASFMPMAVTEVWRLALGGQQPGSRTRKWS